MTADILEFRTKKLTGFIPEPEDKKPEPKSDTAPSEYSAPDDGDGV